MKVSTKIVCGLILSALALAGCTEDRAQKKELKFEVQEKAKSSFGDPNVEYLYAPSSTTAGRQSSFARAYWLGEERIVTMEFDEFNLNVYSIDKEQKFKDNLSNRRLVMKIPVDHLDYRCADDAFGECTSEEIQNNLIPWNQKKFFRAHYENAKVIDPTFLPSGGLLDECFETKESKLVSQSLDDVSLNFKIERNYQNKLYFYCVRGLDDLEDLSWTDVTQYSFVRLDKAVTPNYKKVVYDRSWINTFGLFERNDYILDIDGNAMQDGEIKYLNRWNPERTELVYYLSPEFNKPENAILKSASYESFNRINQGLKTAGVKFQLVLREPDASIDPVDLRNSMIILAEDPFEASVIGYGPSVTNPRSGEIISARTVMYLGSLKRFIRYTYDEIIQQHQENLANASGTPAAPVVAATTPVVTTNFVDIASAAQVLDVKKLLATRIDPIIEKSRTPTITEADMEKAAAYAANQDLVAQLADQGYYPAELVSFGDVSQEVIENLIATIGELKPWETLSEEQRQAVMDNLVPYVWVPTMVHEVGHNLGLRHNFQGSEDKENYYSAEELKALNVPVSSKSVPYSSVMDYPKSEINALRTLGKYDIATLKFAYLGLVEKADGTVVSVNPGAAAITDIKTYGYCSDEGVPLNPNCNPFDEGSGYTAITESLIDGYNDRYKRSNFRRGRANFSTMDDDIYFSGVARTFDKQRMLLELYQDIVHDYKLDQATIDSIDWLKDLDVATEKAADFMMSVIAEPDVQCAFKINGKIETLSLSELAALTKNGGLKSCDEVGFNSTVEVIGQGGKPLNSYKVRSNPNIYADQIDVRGVWINKGLAARTLFRRKLNSTIKDKNNGNFMDHPRVAAKLEPFIANLLNDRMTADVDFVNATTGVTTKLPVSYSWNSNDFEIRKPEMPIVNWVFGVKYDNNNLVDILTIVLMNGIYQGADSPTALALRNSLQVTSILPIAQDDCTTASSCSLLVQGKSYLIRSSSPLAFEVAKTINLIRTYPRLSQTSINTVANLLLNNLPATPTLTAEELLVYNGGLDKLRAFVQGTLPASSYFEKTLINLAIYQ